MKYGYVFAEEHGTGTLTWERVRVRTEVTGTAGDLAAGLRAWAVATATREQCGDGRYSAYLVEPDDKGRYDTRHAVAFEELLWFYGEEHVPAG